MLAFSRLGSERLAAGRWERWSRHANRVSDLASGAVCRSVPRNGALSRCEVVAQFSKLAMLAEFTRRDSNGSSGRESVSRFISRLLLGHGFGAIPAPCGNSLFCFGKAALRVTVSGQILCAKCSEKISPEPPSMQSFGTWEPGPSLGFARCDPSRIGKFNKRRHDHVPEQSQPHRIPRQ
jgi:hypothetical protein